MNFLGESLWVGLGAALGANARYWIGVSTRAISTGFPWPTLMINVVGSFLLGAFAALSLSRGWGAPTRLFFAVGVCGGFTTFSTFSFEALDLFHKGTVKLAILYCLLSLVLSVLACALGARSVGLLRGP